MNAQALIKKADKVLTKYGAPTRKVYKRVITRTGGDQLIGRPGSVSYSDTELNPQPTYQRGGRQSVTGNRVAAEYVVANGRALTPDMAVFLVSPTSMTQVELENPNLVLVMKDASGNTEVFQIDDVNPSTMNGVTVIYTVYARSVQR